MKTVRVFFQYGAYSYRVTDLSEEELERHKIKLAELDIKLEYKGRTHQEKPKMICPKCADKKTEDLKVLKEKCVQCGKTPATMTRDGETFYCEDCAKLLFKGGK